MKGNGQLPYNTRNMEQAGKYHGTGIPGTVGSKKGGFSDNIVKKNPLPKANPPLKMN